MLKLILYLLLGFAAFTASAEPPQAVSPEQLMAQIEAGTAPVLVDVRTPGEFAAGHVPGAVNMPLNELGRYRAELEAMKSEGFLLYCESGVRAGRAATALRGVGFDKLLTLDGHMRRWRGSGLSVSMPK